MFEVIKMLST